MGLLFIFLSLILLSADLPLGFLAAWDQSRQLFAGCDESSGNRQTAEYAEYAEGELGRSLASAYFPYSAVNPSCLCLRLCRAAVIAPARFQGCPHGLSTSGSAIRGRPVQPACICGAIGIVPAEKALACCRYVTWPVEFGVVRAVDGLWTGSVTRPAFPGRRALRH